MIAKPTARKRTVPIITQRLELLAQATARLAKAERLVAQWRRDADKWQKQLWRDPAQDMILRRCADELERILKK